MSDEVVKIARAGVVGTYLGVFFNLIGLWITYFKPPAFNNSSNSQPDQVLSPEGPAPSPRIMALSDEDRDLLRGLRTDIAQFSQQAHEDAKAQLEATKTLTNLLREQGSAELVVVRRAPLPRACDDDGHN